MNLPPSLTKDDFRLISLQIVKDFPATDINKQVNTFSTVGANGNPLHGGVISKQYKDFQRGYYWAREWYAQGHDIDEIGKKEYPICVMENRKRIIESLEKGIGCDEIYIVFIDQYECDNCERTEDEVSDDCQEMLLAYLCELYKYGQYYIEGSWFWYSKGRYDYLVSKSEVPANLEPERTMQDYIPVEKVSINEWGGIYADKVTGWGFKVEICNCKKVEFEMNYSNCIPEPELKGDCHNC